MSRTGTRINKIWFVAAFSFVAMVSVTWKIYQGIVAIQRESEEAHQRIDELMNDRYCSPRGC